VQLPVAELVKLCASHTELYCRTFFPKAFRQPSPPFAKELWQPLENPSVRLANLICFRGSSKTTRLRAFTSKRIAYGVSRTVLYVGASERDAIRSVQWLRTQVERNRLWADAFSLKSGRKWEETQIEIEHGTFGHTIWVLAAGITGSLRGINFDDYRPDLIVVDDPQTDETAATEEQRNKISDLILGAVKNSLAPESDEPNAKLAMAITPQHAADVSQQALKDDQWTSRVFPCWTKETIHLPVEQQKSAWEERLPTAELRKDKEAAIKRNKLSIFMREMECRLISPEAAQFRPSWLNIRDLPNSGPRGVFSVLAIDPVPPPSERQMAKGLQGKDWEAHYVWGRSGGDYHLLDCDRNRGHEPSWTVATAFRLARLWRVARIVVDAVAYQRTLKWILEQEMKRTGIYYQVIPVADGMKKFARVTNVLTGLATAGKLWVGPEHSNFIEQFEHYGPLYSGFDDDLDASALALQELNNPYIERLDDKGNFSDDNVEEFPFARVCP
jgi:phage terminase large subunit-like protein